MSGRRYGGTLGRAPGVPQVVIRYVVTKHAPRTAQRHATASHPNVVTGGGEDSAVQGNRPEEGSSIEARQYPPPYRQRLERERPSVWGDAGAGTRYTVTKHVPSQLGDLPPPPI
ncbi:hypothetical protein E2C01_025851 [Portunus trituberculatus]|uniref:Uncharacterized protein n=1 Tax=Portunus trituberculatus TaxID=210409 RepID=A0A5B7EH29_PORTR|nr:hypothetical protein [Portunus trituberculatus]